MVGVTSHWVDKRLGKKGYGIWIAPIGLFFVAYQAPVALNFVCVRQDSLALILIFSCILFYFAILFIGGILLCYHAIRTAQSIVVDESRCIIRFYFNRMIKLPLSHIKGVYPIKLGLGDKIMTLLDHSRNNYRIDLKNGSYFYVSGAMPNADEFVNWLTGRLPPPHPLA